jgi:hypothetical protein
MKKTRAGLGALVVLGFAICSPAHAGLVTIDADDYAAGTNVSNLSPYVKLSNGFSTADPSFGDPVFSATSPFAPTGSRVFATGPSGGGFAFLPESQRVGGVGDTIAWGLALAFDDPVSNITLSALNFGYGPGLSVQGWVVDAAGNVTSIVNTAAIGLGGSLAFNVAGGGISTLIIGGEDSIAALQFDSLSFQVPEPGTLGLLLAGAAAVGLFSRRRRAASAAA